MNQIQKNALVNSFITLSYIVGIGLFLYFGTLFKIGANSFVTPIVFLMLFVFSAAFTSYFMLGRPVLMYLDGKKKEALSLLGYTLGFFFLFTIIGLALLILVPR